MYQMMFYVGLAGMIVFLVAAIILFFYNDVAKLLGDVTGWNAKRGIREETQHAAQRVEVNVSQKEKRMRRKQKRPKTEEVTELLVRDAIEDEVTMILTEDEKTELLKNDDATDVLMEDATDVLSEDEVTDILINEEVTDVLFENINISSEDNGSILDGAVLSDLEGIAPERKLTRQTELPMPDIFVVEEDTTITHTDERIGE